MISIAAISLSDMVQPTSAQQARETPHEAIASVAHGVNQIGMPKAGSRLPSKWNSFEIEAPKVHAPVQQHREAKTAAGFEFQHA